MHSDGLKSRKEQLSVVGDLIKSFIIRFFWLGFLLVPDLEEVAGYSVLDSDLPEYRRNLDRLDKVLSNIEQYVHLVYATLKKEDVASRICTMVSCFGIWEGQGRRCWLHDRSLLPKFRWKRWVNPTPVIYSSFLQFRGW
jgi:hypothetical protein